MKNTTLEEKAEKTVPRSTISRKEKMTICTYNGCGKIFPEKDAKYQGPVVLCPDCYQSWFDTED